MVVIASSSLSPICKNEIRKAEVELRTMKIRLLEMVRTKVGMEDNLWLNSFIREIVLEPDVITEEVGVEG